MVEATKGGEQSKKKKKGFNKVQVYPHKLNQEVKATR